MTTHEARLWHRLAVAIRGAPWGEFRSIWLNTARLVMGGSSLLGIVRELEQERKKTRPGRVTARCRVIDGQHVWRRTRYGRAIDRRVRPQP